MTVAVSNDVRERAAEAFAKLGWPTTKIEEWRYTNLAPLQKIDWRFDESPRLVESPASLKAHAAMELVFVNGKHVAGENLYPTSSEPGHVADVSRNAMASLNTANMQDGARIEIPAGVALEGFIHLLFIGEGDGIWSHPRNLIVVGRNAQVSIVETYVGSGRYFTNAVTEILAGDGAVVDHTKVQCESLDAFHIGSIWMRQEHAANVVSRSFMIGGALARTETHVALDGEGASVALDGLFAGTGTQHLDNLTAVDHIRPHCDSIQLYKGVLDQSARGVFDGRIIVRPGAQKTNSRQENRNLLLSETAIVDSKPNLEIHNDDVKCSHGSTIGQIDEEQLFYMRSRGIDADAARNLLIHAFAGEIVDRIRIDSVREQIRRALFRLLPERLPERRGNSR